MANFALRLPPDLHDELRHYAASSERSLNGLIVYVLRSFMETVEIDKACYTREPYNGVTVASSAAAPNDTEECRR